jgi:N-6 DNA Methylase
MATSQSQLLKACFYGPDILPQAVELAKLSLWLAAARKNEPSADLSKNFVVGDSLQGAATTLLQNAGGKFDLIVGNPPWGGDIDMPAAKCVLRAAGLSDGFGDSWEVFLALVVSALKPNGRFGILVPDTIFSPEKKRTRAWLLDDVTLEKVFSLGADWFTSDVRMDSVSTPAAVPPQLVLAGQPRIAAQQGKKPLHQLEKALTRHSAQSRFKADEERQIKVLASDEDLSLLSRIDSRSTPVSELTVHTRGDEINAEGLLWRCGNCMTYTVPGEKHGGGYRTKACPSCGAQVTAKDVAAETLISETRRGPYKTPYVDGRSLTRRYEAPLRRFMRQDLVPLRPSLKPASLFAGPKVLIRQAGVGVTATLVDDDARSPQSVYLYRITDEARWQGYSNEFVLACLVSRTMNFVVMKKFGEIDPARAFAKLTHARIGSLPIPIVDDDAKRQMAAQIEQQVRMMLAAPDYGGSIDQTIEQCLRGL